MATLRTTPRQGSSDEGLPPLVPGERLDQKTFHARYEAMPAEVRAELIQGVVYMPSPLRIDHGEIHAELITWLTCFKAATPGTRVTDNATTILGSDDEPQPDATLLILPSHGGQTREADGYITGAPEFVAEVALASAEYDLHAKKQSYEKAGVREYLVVVLRERRVVWLVRSTQGFLALKVGPNGIYRSPFFPGLWLDPEALLRADTNRLLEVIRQGLASPEHAQFVTRLVGP